MDPPGYRDNQQGEQEEIEKEGYVSKEKRKKIKKAFQMESSIDEDEGEAIPRGLRALSWQVVQVQEWSYVQTKQESQGKIEKKIEQEIFRNVKKN